ncbi:MAG: cytochrome c [Myxococcota bacterium]|nr:cytochrome c [Myxococcota bacterium]
MSGRREWLRGALRVGGLGLALALGGGHWLGRDRIARWRAERALRERVAPVEIPNAVMDAFLADVVRHDPALAARLHDDVALDLLAGRLLLSTDFFARGAGASGELAYLRYANVYVSACSNPFARFVDAPLPHGGEPARAEALYHAHCAACHDMGVGPDLAGVDARLGDGLDTIVREGRGAMPSARSLGLDDDAIARLVAWLRGR